MNNDAKEQVEAFIVLLQERYGLSESDISGVIQQLMRLRKRTQYAEKLGEWTAKTVITVLVTAFFSGMAWALVHFIDSVAKR